MKFARKLSSEAIGEWSPSEVEGGFLGIDAANRFFTPIWLVPNNKESSSHPKPCIDPYGLITKVLDQGEMLHLEDNSVEYYEKYTNREGDSV